MAEPDRAPSSPRIQPLPDEESVVRLAVGGDRLAFARLMEHYGWEDYGGKHYESTITGFVQSYLLPVKFQIDYRRATLSSQICAGDITRAEALEILKTPPFDTGRVRDETVYVAKKFGISPEEMDAILAAPPRTYRDYPNNEKLLEFLYGVYRRFFTS